MDTVYDTEPLTEGDTVCDTARPRLLLCGLLGLFACGRVSAAAPAAPSQRAQDQSARTSAAADGPAAPRVLSRLDHEPMLGILLARTERATLRVERRTELRRQEAGGGERAQAPPAVIQPCELALEATAAGWRIAGGPSFDGDAVLHAPGEGPAFEVEALPPFGDPQRLAIAGDLLVHPTKGEIELVERLPMEDYIASVVSAEMNPTWPRAALAAQAIVARSYAAARWMERSDEAWQLHWHFGVDMAYRGWRPVDADVARAIAPTRGEVLVYRGLPVLALFHASSGGRTESFERVKPGVLAPDEKTPIAPAMPVVDDPAALPGAAALGLSATHGHWKADVPLPEVTEALQAWSKKARDRPTFGTVEGVSIEERHPDSLRVATVSIRHRLDGAQRFTRLDAHDFRLAIGPVRLRSLWWDRCVIASKPPGYLVIEGRGFGHGCGLSQVSAWYLATQGESPETIVSRFYAGAKLERRY